MSQFREAELPFPWWPIIITAIGCILIFLVFKWTAQRIWCLWLEYQSSSSSSRTRKNKNKKKKHSKKKFSDSSSSEESSEDSS